MTPHEERDFSYLEKDEIIFSFLEYEYKAKVHIDYNIGLSIILNEDTICHHNTGPQKHNKGFELFCLNGEFSKHETTEYYKTKFYSSISQIKKGYFSLDKYNRLWESCGRKALGGSRNSFRYLWSIFSGKGRYR